MFNSLGILVAAVSGLIELSSVKTEYRLFVSSNNGDNSPSSENLVLTPRVRKMTDKPDGQREKCFCEYLFPPVTVRHFSGGNYFVVSISLSPFVLRVKTWEL